MKARLSRGWWSRAAGAEFGFNRVAGGAGQFGLTDAGVDSELAAGGAPRMARRGGFAAPRAVGLSKNARNLRKGKATPKALRSSANGLWKVRKRRPPCLTCHLRLAVLFFIS